MKNGRKIINATEPANLSDINFNPLDDSLGWTSKPIPLSRVVAINEVTKLKKSNKRQRNVPIEI